MFNLNFLSFIQKTTNDKGKSKGSAESGEFYIVDRRTNLVIAEAPDWATAERHVRLYYDRSRVNVVSAETHWAQTETP